MKGAPVDVARVAELTNRGWSAREIAVELGCTARSVVRARARAGVSRDGGRPFTDEELWTAELMLADGCSVIEIERTLGRAIGTFSRKFKGRGWTRQEVSDFARACRQAAATERTRQLTSPTR